MRIICTAALLIFASSMARADDYYNQKWFDFPDMGSLPQITLGCAKQSCTDVPEFHGFNVEMVRQCVCVAPTQKTELLRRDVRVIVSGPPTGEEAAKRALTGYAAGCVSVATAASTAGPQIVAQPAGFFAAFKGCVAAISMAGVIGGIMNQFEIRINTSDTHWAPL